LLQKDYRLHTHILSAAMGWVISTKPLYDRPGQYSDG